MVTTLQQCGHQPVNLSEAVNICHICGKDKSWTLGRCQKCAQQHGVFWNDDLKSSFRA